jgi:hypothetical protein
MKIITITPQMAITLMEKNINNRNITKQRVDLYADQIRSGSWVINGESIKVDKNGRLIDGQHRLLAIIKANKPITTYYVDDIEPEAFPTIDSGRSRSNGDNFQFAGIKNANQVSSLINICLCYKKMIESGSQAYPNDKIPVSELLKFYDQKWDLVERANQYSRDIWMRLRISRSKIGAMYILLSEYGDVTEFFKLVLEPENLSKNHPCYLLREKLIVLQQEKHNYYKYYYLVISAWNHYLNGNRTSFLKHVRSNSFLYPEKA